MTTKQEVKDWLQEQPEYPQLLYINASTIEEANLKLAAFAEEGYKLAEMSVTEGVIHFALYLDVGYRNVVRLADVKPQDVDLYLDEGWEIASTSISTKFVRMIKRGNREHRHEEGQGASAEFGVAD